jgi:alanine-glyoxylate transaminase / serine-glyoxylate transaminase / serine-pyruvate transaminase
MATLAGCEMGLKLAGVNLAESGLSAAMSFIANKVSRAGLRVAA